VGIRTLANFLERIWAGTAWDGTKEPDTRPECLHHGAIETVVDVPEAQILRVRGLHLILLEWLYFEYSLGGSNVVTRNVFGHYRPLFVGREG